MGTKLRTAIVRLSRTKGFARGIFKKMGIAAKVRRAKGLPMYGQRPPKAPPSAWVQRLPSGRYPANYRWANQVYRGKNWTRQLDAKYPAGVKFTRDGYPDFGPYIYTNKSTGKPVQVIFKNGFQGRSADFAKANRLFDPPDGYTWHHHQDGKTLQLIPTDLHEAIRHSGGIAKTGGR